MSFRGGQPPSRKLERGRSSLSVWSLEFDANITKWPRIKTGKE